MPNSGTVFPNRCHRASNIETFRVISRVLLKSIMRNRNPGDHKWVSGTGVTQVFTHPFFSMKRLILFILLRF